MATGELSEAMEREASVPAAPSVPRREEPWGSEPEYLELETPEGRVPLGFVGDGKVVHLVARDRAARWPVTVLREGRAHLSIASRWVEGMPRLITEPAEKQTVLAHFRSKYGDDRFARWYDRPARVLAVRLTSVSPSPAASHYYDWLAAEFDNVADDYDRHIAGNRINRLLRDRSLARLRRTFASTRYLIEIGCGSGTETLPLLRDGHELLCVDISPRMLDVVRAKARAEGLAERLRTRELRASSLGQLVTELGAGSLDGGYSTYGALNCEADLAPIPPALYDLLRPDARFVAGVYNRWCLFELLGYTLAARPGRAFGRARRPVPVGSSRFCVDVFAYSPAEFDRRFRPWFDLEDLEAVPIVLPPSDLVGYAERFARRFDRIAAWDRAIGTRWPLRNLGDHFLATFARRNGAAASPRERAT